MFRTLLDNLRLRLAERRRARVEPIHGEKSLVAQMEKIMSNDDVKQRGEAMRAEKDVWPNTIEELMAYVQKQVDGEHDYNTAVYAMSLAAVAAFHYVAHALGTSGFQASCATLDIVRRNNGIEGPFILLKGEDLLYPQYSLLDTLNEFLTSAGMKKWLREQARLKLAENHDAHPDVRARWEELAR